MEGWIKDKTHPSLPLAYNPGGCAVLQLQQKASLLPPGELGGTRT